jgi:hypothetical protein
MRKLLVFAAVIAFLYSSWGPSWGPSLAIWLLIIGAFLLVGPTVAKLNKPDRRHSDDY